MDDTKEDVIQDLESDGIRYANDVYYTKSRNTNNVKWISIPDIYHDNKHQSYYYVLNKDDRSQQVQHISADKIINKNHKYKRYLKWILSTTTNKEYKLHLKRALKIAKKIRHKKYKKIRNRKIKRKYIKKGQKMAYSKVFKHNMGELGHRMRGNARIRKYGSDKLVKMKISKDLMNEFGKKHIIKIRNDKNAVKELLGGPLKIKNAYGRFKLYNIDMDYNANTEWFKIYHSVKYKDKAKHLHLEKAIPI